MTLSDNLRRYLRVGPYEIKVSHPGFAEAVQSLNLSVGAAFDFPILLSVASAELNVFVEGKQAVLEAARSQVAGTVPAPEIQALPLNSRSFLDVAYSFREYRPPIQPPTSCWPRPRRFRARVFLSEANATSRIASLLTACPITTTPRALTQPVAAPVLEAKAEHLPCTHGLEQGKWYATAKRLNVPFVIATNGHQSVEYDRFTGLTSKPKPMSGPLCWGIPGGSAKVRDIRSEIP